LRKERPDVLHCHLPLSIIIGAIAGRLAGVPCVIAHHHNTWAFNSWKINLLLMLVKPFISLHICYAASVEEELFGETNLIDTKVTARPRHSCTIYNLLDTSEIERVLAQTDRSAKRRELGVKEGDFLVLTVARLIDWKGTDTAIRAMPHVLERVPSARLLIVGEGPERTTLEALIRESVARDRISMLGARPDVYEVEHAADAFVGVYRYGVSTQTKEAVGVAILEAMAAGLPVVVSDYPSARVYITPMETGMVVPPDDPSALAQVLIALAEDPALARRIREGGRTFVRTRLSLERVVPVYESLYRALVQH
jgi:glycosyltransferase involved in cell wall biosynthesis